MKEINDIHGIKCGPAFPVGRIAYSNKIVKEMHKKYPEVQEVYDALEPVQLALMSRDVVAGTPKDHANCAFARAACTVLKADGAYIGIEMACLKFEDKFVRFHIPESVAREIVCFDRHHDCDPDKTYRFSAIEPHRQLGRKDKVPRKKGPKYPTRRKGEFVSKRRTAHIRKIERS